MFAALSALRESLGSFGSRKGVEVKSSGIFCASFLIIALLYGCGGGDGGGSAMTPPPAPPAVMPQVELRPSVQAAQAPQFGFDGSLHIGTGVAPPAGELQKTGERNGVEISKGSVRDGAGAADVIAYLRPATIHSDIVGLTTFARPPIVRVVEGTNEKYTDYAVRAVQIINTALPYDKRIAFGDSPAPDPVNVEDVPRGSIYIEFIPQSEWPAEDALDQSAVGNARSQALFRYNSRRKRNEALEAHSSHVLIDSGEVRNFPGEKTVYVLVHELLHALGFSGHTDPMRFPDATLNPKIPRVLPPFLLSLIDGEALLAAYDTYDRFRPGALPEDISVENLGPWDEASFHVRGDLEIVGGEVSFGVAFRNNLAQPWASGPEPPMDLAQNGGLSGTATWSGALLGVTPSGEVVVGDSRLAVDLANLDGQIDFTGMEFDGGEMWEDGALGYSIEVRGNSFTRTGGDAGEVTGAFFGPRHEGMGGVLERSDLSAGFGGKR